MKTIWKFPIEPLSEFTISMPVGAEIIHVAVQYDEPQLWAVVETDADLELRRFYVRSTGHEMPDEAVRHVGSLLMNAGALVLHVFEPQP